MIKFFRKIRQNLLSEGNTKNYLKYAFGEIILVVIGILIALQINNFNEHEKNIKKEKYLVQEMLNEFKRDSIKLQNYIRLTSGKSKYGKQVKSCFNGNQIGKDTLLVNLFFNGKALFFKSFTPTYDEIVSSGQLNLIRNDSLKGLIKNFKKIVESQETFIYSDIQDIKEQYNFHLYHYFDHEIISKLWDWASFRDSISSMAYTNGLIKDFDGFFKDPQSYYHVATNIGADTELNRAYATQILPRLNLVLEALRKEEKNDKIL